MARLSTLNEHAHLGSDPCRGEGDHTKMTENRAEANTLFYLI